MASALALLATLAFATPAADDRGAMLLGNGEIGETAWIDAQGTLECVPLRGENGPATPRSHPAIDSEKSS